MTEFDVHFPEWDASPAKRSLRVRDEPSPVLTLTNLLETELRIKTKSIGVINRLAVQKTISRWLKEGITKDQIKQMIHIYITDKSFRRGNGPEWKRFIYHRDTLMARISSTEDIDWFDTGEESSWDD